jgi:hypothetical protein
MAAPLCYSRSAAVVRAAAARQQTRVVKSRDVDPDNSLNAGAVVPLVPKKHLFLNVRRECLLVPLLGKKCCDINKRLTPF